MTSARNHPNYLLVWLWLLGLVFVSLGASLLLPKTAALLIIFAAATIKAILVVLNFMHLKYERPLLYMMAVVPVVIIVLLVIALFPDFVLRG